MAYKYYFDVKTLYLIPGFSTIKLDKYAYTLCKAPVLQDIHVLISVEDFKTIYSHVFEVEDRGEKLIITGGTRQVQTTTTGDERLVTVDVPLGKVRRAAVPVQIIDGIRMLPLDTVLVDVYDYRRVEKKTVERNHIIMFTCEPDVWEITSEHHKYFDNLVRGKTCGDLYETFWFEAGSKLVPYRIYLPVDYDKTKKYPAIFYLHGGHGSPNTGWESSKGMLPYLADKNGYIVVGTDGFIRDSTYGYCLPPNPGDPRIDPACPENPLHYTPEKLMEFKLGELGLESVISYTCEKFAVDKKNLFLMGNSMGGEGSFWFALTHPGMFNAISPAGAMINTKLVDMTPLKGLPILFTGGTEDVHGFDYLYSGVKDMEKFGLDIHHNFVGGGSHGNSWVTGLEETFRFFNQYRK